MLPVPVSVCPPSRREARAGSKDFRPGKFVGCIHYSFRWLKRMRDVIQGLTLTDVSLDPLKPHRFLVEERFREDIWTAIVTG